MHLSAKQVSGLLGMILGDVANQYIGIQAYHDLAAPFSIASCISLIVTGLSGVGTIPFNSCMDIFTGIMCTRFPGCKSNALRIFLGRVICPLLVIFEVT